MWSWPPSHFEPLTASGFCKLLVLASGDEKEMETQNCKATQFYFDFGGY